MAKKQKIQHFDEGGDARGGMGFAGTGSGLSGSGAGAASAGVGGGNNGDGGGDGGGSKGNASQNDSSPSQPTSSETSTPETASPFAVMSTGFQQTPANIQALADQQTVRDFLAKVQADKETAKTKPGETGNFVNPNVGTNVTNALQAAMDSGVNVQHFLRSVGKTGNERDIESKSTNIPIASFLGYTGAPGDNALSYGEAKMMQSLKAGDLTGVNLNNMTGTGLSVANAEGNPWSGVTSENIGQDANSIVAATDAANVAEKVWGIAKNFIPGFGAVEMLSNLMSGKLTLGDIFTGIGINRLAALAHVPAPLLSSAIELNGGNMLSSLMTNAAIKDISSEAGIHPLAVTIGLQESGALDGLRQMLNPLNANLGAKAGVSNAINTGLKNLGVTMGTGTSTGTSFNTGDAQQDQIDRYLGNSSGGGGLNAAPAAPANPANPAGNTGKTSAANSFGGFGGPSGSSSPDLSPVAAAVALPLAGYYKTKQLPHTMFQDQLAEFRRLQQSENPEANVYSMREPTPQAANSNPAYSYGVETPIQDILNPTEQADKYANIPDYLYPTDGMGVPDYMKTNLGLPAATGGAIGGTRYGRYARGGLSVPLMAHGGKLRVDFRHGDAVTGEGDGQSDDIPAMLADGEFVFPADVVAAIGNGSTKAGSDKLYEMMHGIRAHVRSAKPQDLPPEIKSPLDFLKNTKRTKARS